MTAAVSTKVTTWLTNEPQVKSWPSTVTVPPFTPPPPASPISGSRNDSVKDVTTPVNAAPITTATASSTTFPRSRKSLKPLSTHAPLGRDGHLARPLGHGRRTGTGGVAG